MFWSVDDDFYNVEQMFENKQQYADTARSRGVSQSDLDLLATSFDHMYVYALFLCLFFSHLDSFYMLPRSRAASNRLWKSIHAHEDIPYRVYNMPQMIFEAWTRTELKLGHTPPEELTAVDSPAMVLMHPDRLAKLRKAILSEPLISTTQLAQWGNAIGSEDRQNRELYLENQKIRKKNRRRGKDSDNPKTKTTLDSVWKITSAGKMKEERVLHLAQEKQKQKAFFEEDRTVLNSSTPDDALAAKATSPLAGVRVGQSASSKLNFIIAEVWNFIKMLTQCQ